VANRSKSTASATQIQLLSRPASLLLIGQYIRWFIRKPDDRDDLSYLSLFNCSPRLIVTGEESDQRTTRHSASLASAMQTEPKMAQNVFHFVRISDRNEKHQVRCKSANSLPYTFANESRNNFSNIDYIVYNNVSVNNFTVVEPDINFSDHLPICESCVINFSKLHQPVDNNRHKSTEQYLRWDHADLLLYYNITITRDYLQPILNELSDL